MKYLWIIMLVIILIGCSTNRQAVRQPNCFHNEVLEKQRSQYSNRHLDNVSRWVNLYLHDKLTFKELMWLVDMSKELE